VIAIGEVALRVLEIRDHGEVEVPFDDSGVGSDVVSAQAAQQGRQRQELLDHLLFLLIVALGIQANSATCLSSRSFP